MRMFTSNKKREKQAVGASVFMLCRVFITFYSLNCPQITLRFILGSCCFSKPFSNSPVSIYAKALHFSWWHSHSTQKKRAEQSKDTLSLFLLLASSLSNVHFHTQYRKHLYRTHFYGKNANLSMLYRILFHFLFRKEFSCTRSGSNDLLSYGMNFVGNLSFLPGFILREERKNKTNNLKRKKWEK